MKLKHILGLILLLLSTPLLRAQGSRISGVAQNASGAILPGAGVALCTPLATTAASVTANIATLTMASNPTTAGFVAGQSETVSGFTAGDAVLNGTWTLVVVSATTISYATPATTTLTASSNGTVLQPGTSTQACASLVAVYTDATLGTPATNATKADGLGNFGWWVAPGNYKYQIYGPTVGQATSLLYDVTAANYSQSIGTSLYCGATSGATQLCSQTMERLPFIAWGDVLLNTATTQSITGLPFTAATYSCSGSDLTTAAGVVSFNTYANTSVTIQENGGANTDHLRFICAGN